MRCTATERAEYIEVCRLMDLNPLANISASDAQQILLDFRNTRRNLEPSIEIVFIILYILLIGLGLCANMLLIFVVARKSQLHTPRNLYIVNLSISDMTMCIICMPFTLVVILQREWTLGITLCKLVPVLQGTNVMISTGTITAIALDRYFTIVQQHATVSNRTNVILRISLVWTASVLVSLPLAFYQGVEVLSYHNIVLYETCIEIWPSHSMRILYTACILLIQAVIPSLVVSVVHIQIASYLHQHTRCQSNEIRAQKDIDRNMKTTVLLLSIAILFLLCWLPLTIFSLIADILYPPHEVPKISLRTFYTILATCHAIAMSSAIINPVVYGFMNSNVRKEFQQLFSVSGMSGRCRLHTVNGDEQTTTRTVLATSSHRKSAGPVTLQLKSDNLEKSSISPSAQVDSFML